MKFCVIESEYFPNPFIQTINFTNLWYCHLKPTITSGFSFICFPASPHMFVCPHLSCFCLLFSCFNPPFLFLYSVRLMKEKSVDTVDDGFMERAMPMEKEYQRVSISGEEKCGVRNYFHIELNVFKVMLQWVKFTPILNVISLSVDVVPGALHWPGWCCKVCCEGIVHPGEVYKSIYAELL